MQDEAVTSGQAVERTGDHVLPVLTEEGSIPIRPLVDGEAPQPLDTKITLSREEKVQTCVISNQLP